VGTYTTTTVGGSNNFIAGGNVYVARQHLGNASDTLTTPSYSWLGALTTGMYRQASNVVAFTANGVDQLRIGPQSLGVGSSAAQVNVRGDLTMIQGGAIVPSTSSGTADASHGIIWQQPTGTSGTAWIKWYAGGFSSAYTTLEIGTGNDTHDILYFNTSGKVGFGVAVPAYKVDVSGDVNVTGNYYVNGVVIGTGSGTVTSVAMNTNTTGLSVSGGTSQTITTSGTFSLTWASTVPTNGIYIPTANTLGFASNSTDAMRVNSNSVVTMTNPLPIGSGGTGLGSVPANGQLDIGNGTGFTRTVLTAGSGVSIANGVGSITISATGSGGTVTSLTQGTGVTLSPNPITTSGSISIGQAVGTSNNVQFNAIGAGAANSTAGTIIATGEITAYSSDARLKQNISLITDPISKIMSLRGVMFDWDINKASQLGFNPSYQRDVGVIAQDIQAVLPEAVRPAPFDRTPDGLDSISGEHYLTVQYEKLTALLIEAVKQLKTEVDDLRARLDAR
jgi:hypothetical protein